VVAALGVAALMIPSVAAAKDRNHDRIPDRWEKRHGLSLKVNQAHKNQDHDALVNRQEFKAGDDPLDADSNNDGIDDGEDGAGTIASFDGTTLVINQFDGSTLSGQVTDQTEIECDNGDDQGDEDNDGEGGGDDNSGSGGDDKAGFSASASDDNSDDQGEDDGNVCTTADLVPGAVVQEAELDDTGTTFEQVQIMTGNNDLVGDND
jgi:hypothetical protein